MIFLKIVLSPSGVAGNRSRGGLNRGHLSFCCYCSRSVTLSEFVASLGLSEPELALQLPYSSRIRRESAGEHVLLVTSIWSREVLFPFPLVAFCMSLPLVSRKPKFPILWATNFSVNSVYS